MALLNTSSLEDISDSRLLIPAGILFTTVGGWLDLVLTYWRVLFGFIYGICVYQKALDDNGYNYKLHYEKPRRPYNQNMKTNIGRGFLKILDNRFPATNKLHKIFNQNTVKMLRKQ